MRDFLKHVVDLARLHVKEPLAVLADIITVKDLLIPAVLASPLMLNASTMRTPVYPPATVQAAIEGICSRETLVKTLADGSFGAKGTGYALAIKEACKVGLTREYLARKGEKNGDRS
jgi:hypothetical protein